MTEYKVGDRVRYKDHEGTILSRIGGLYEVMLGVKEGRYLYADEIKPLKKHVGCPYCNHGQPLNDIANSDFAIQVLHDENNYYIETDYEADDWNDSAYGIIQYCPMCGRKLEVAE